MLKAAIHSLKTLRTFVQTLASSPLAAKSSLPKLLSRRNWRMAPLTFNDGPLVWIDCEMTGLDYKNDKIIEIAVIITDGNLAAVDNGVQYIVHTEKEVLDRMDDWCTKQHGSTGLTQACLDSPHSMTFVEDAVLKYIKKWVPEKMSAVLAGNSVHADRAFLLKDMPTVVEWLHYRIVDVSSIKELHRRWYPTSSLPRTAESNHRALDDIHCSIRELKWYRDNIFVDPQSLRAGSLKRARTT